MHQHVPYAPESDYRSVKENRNKKEKEGSDATSEMLSPEPFSPADTKAMGQPRHEQLSRAGE